MSKEAFKLILFSIGFIIFVGMLFSGSFIPSNVIAPDEFETVTGRDPIQNQPDYGQLTEEQKTVADRAIGNLLNIPDLNITLEQVGVVKVTEESFSDTSLGCAKEDMVYLQVITPGYKVLLKVDGTTYDYRLDQAEQIVLCENSI